MFDLLVVTQRKLETVGNRKLPPKQQILATAPYPAVPKIPLKNSRIQIVIRISTETEWFVASENSHPSKKITTINSCLLLVRIPTPPKKNSQQSILFVASDNSHPSKKIHNNQFVFVASDNSHPSKKFHNNQFVNNFLSCPLYLNGKNSFKNSGSASCSGSSPKSNRCSHTTHPKISSKFINNFLNYPADKGKN